MQSQGEDNPAPTGLEISSLDIPAGIFENVDLSVPEEYLTEVMAVEALQTLAAYHKALVHQRVARHMGSKGAEDLAKGVAELRNVIGLIYHEYPKVKSLIEPLAKYRVETVREDRRSIGAADG